MLPALPGEGAVTNLDRKLKEHREKELVRAQVSSSLTPDPPACPGECLRLQLEAWCGLGVRLGVLRVGGGKQAIKIDCTPSIGSCL